MPVVGQISVGDGATFTPSVSNSGVISWSNDKNLPNPASVDIAGVVQTAISGVYLPTAGGTVTGNLTVNGTLTGNLSGNATTATTATTALSATTATSATNDGNGNEITATYLPLAGGTLTGNLTENSDLIVNGNAALNTISATGNATVGGALGVTGATTLASVSVTGSTDVANITASGDITANDITLSGALSVAGITTLTDDVSVGADLNVTGNITAGADITVTGDISATDITASGDITADDVTANGNLSVVGNATLSGVSTAVTPAEDDNSTKIATTAYVQTEIKPIEADVSSNDKRISNIEKLLQGNLYDYQTDSDSKYTKTVPNGAMPYASLDSVGGKTVVWNQLNANDSSTATVSDIVFTNNLDGSWTINGTASANSSKTFGYNDFVNGHKYYIKGCPSGGSASTYSFGVAGSKEDVGNGGILTATATGHYNLRFNFASGSSFTNVTIYPMLIDLTLLYGAGNEPSTVAEFQQMFPAQYYSYNAGTLLSAGVTEVVSKGKNLWKMQMAGYGGSFYNIAVGSTLSFNGSSVPITDNGDGSFAFTCTGGWQGAFFLMPIDVAKEHRLHFGVSDSNLRMSWYMLDKDYKVLYVVPYTSNTTVNALVGGAGTSHPTTKYICVTIGTNTANTTITVTQPMLEVSSTSSPYVPYVEHSYPIPAEVQALEGYGWSAGSVFNYIDYEAKKFVKRVGAVDIGTLNFGSLSTPESSVFRTLPSDISPLPKTPLSSATLGNIISAKYSNMTYSAISASNNNCMAISPSLNNRLTFVNQSYTDITAFTNAMSGVMLYYELATPQEIDISEYLTDDNLIEVEAGGTLTFPNSNGDDYRIDVPSSETFMVDLQSAI